MHRYPLFLLVFGVVSWSLPALAAADGAPYVGIHGLASSAEDGEAGILSDIEYDTGFGAGVTLGYEYGPRYSRSRTELEVSYRTSEIDDLELFSQDVAGDGEVNALSVLGNAIYVFNNSTPVKPYLLGGVGAAWVEIDEAKIGNVVAIDDDQVGFAFQAGAGLDVWISEHFCIDVGYRYFRTDSDDMENEVGEKFDFDYETHNASLGLRYTF